MTKSSILSYNTHLIYEVLGSYPADFIKLSPLSMEIYSFETIHCLNFNTQGQKRYNVTNDVKIKLLICGFARCIKNMLFLANILFYYSQHICNGIRRKVDIDFIDSFLPKVSMF